jgi:hypothetical protein
MKKKLRLLITVLVAAVVLSCTGVAAQVSSSSQPSQLQPRFLFRCVVGDRLTLRASDDVNLVGLAPEFKAIPGLTKVVVIAHSAVFEKQRRTDWDKLFPKITAVLVSHALMKSEAAEAVAENLRISCQAGPRDHKREDVAKDAERPKATSEADLAP